MHIKIPWLNSHLNVEGTYIEERTLQTFERLSITGKKL